MTQEELMEGVLELIAGATDYLAAADQINGHKIAEQASPMARSILEHRVSILNQWVTLMKQAEEDSFRRDYVHEKAHDLLVNPNPIQMLSGEEVDPVLAQLLDLSHDFFAQVVRLENAQAA